MSATLGTHLATGTDSVRSTMSRVGAATAAATSIAFPAHQAGDLIMLFVYKSAFGATPANWTPVGTLRGPNLKQAGGKTFMFWKYADSSSETSGTWTNAVSISVAIYRNVSYAFTNDILCRSDDDGFGDTTTTLSYGGFDGDNGDADVWYVGFSASDTSGCDTTPTGMSVPSGVTEVATHAVYDTNGYLAGTFAFTTGVSSQGWGTAAFAIIPKSTTTLTVTATPAVGEQIHAFWLTDHDDPSFFQQSWVAPGGEITDSKGGLWSVTTGYPDNYPLIGQNDNSVTDGGLNRRFLIGSAMRISGPALAAGDTITVQYANTPQPNAAIIIVHGFNGLTSHKVEENWGDYGTTISIAPADTFIDYGNGNIGELPFGPNPLGFNDVLWKDVYDGYGLNTAPAETSAFLAIAAAYNGYGFAPFELGTVIAEATSGPFYLAVIFQPNVIANGVCREQGGMISGTPLASSCSYVFVSVLNLPQGHQALSTF